ncbi:MarR family winged helix-turn-helix transcriptional regulator [Roseateles toxinivorans]|uniref:DNA-binding MarR family transcriptional regulator n=1 Tax=Roseateles toxinivorans TaxID=270368 RepID=A0A4R6QMY5_9BURK|nr:MarR family transcriptional regulator [Roseateles toxinivorans]TDP71490.1 DNA-binding MarR family transcriptional regulator [Roseateles toxinivorans]
MNRSATHSPAPDAPDAPLLPVAGLAYGVLDDLLGYALRRAQNALYLDFFRATEAFDVSPQRFAALVLVAENPGLRQGLLAQAMGLHRSGALRLTNWLAQRGWVERRDDPVDARSWGLHLTASGLAQVKALTAVVRAHDAALSQALGKQATGLKQTLEHLALLANASAVITRPA